MKSAYAVLLLSFLCSFNCFSTAASDSDYDALVQCFSDNKIPQSQISQIVYGPSNPSFTSVLQSYIRNRRFNTSSTPKPAIIVTPLEASHVSTTVICAKKIGIQLKIRSGGHDYEGISYVSDVSFIILDMFNLRNVDLDLKDETAWVQAGATLGELYYRIWEKSKVHGFPAGVCPTVAVGGHLTGGGYGNMLRKYGLSVDHIVDALVVDIQGRVLDRAAMGEDLFWAIRGGGGASFGVILAYKIQLVPVPPVVTVFHIQKGLDQNATEAVLQYQEVMQKIDNDLFIRVLLQPITKDKTRTVRATFIGMFLGDSNRLLSITSSEFPGLGLLKADCKEMSWIDSVLYWANFDNTTSPNVLLNRSPDSVNFLKRKSDYVKTPIPKTGLESLWKAMVDIGKVGLVFNSYGGRMNEIPESETPFPHRAGNIFKIQYSVNWNEEDAASDKNYIDQIRNLYSFMTPFVSSNPRESFLNYRDLDIGITDYGKNSFGQGKVYGEKYFKGNFYRLVKTKSTFDPDNFFRNEQSIPTSGAVRGRKGRTF
ncbi:berberine bridge enzyme-like 21 [Olea europaea var. sylvestris]|uniref:Berberine bridge enzyme-like 21 n=1 Tax=Olea europaea subsp. europaea TaxID=158383 RepID=A0A8S0RWJ1_OLEEU|nr:berberine bridge enzyme-like 21 [Olea europaea var. sylvestris]CAA2984545.1 berberine bridge enzyme-like 21 [Olea europaea subsp. europaea]